MAITIAWSIGVAASLEDKVRLLIAICTLLSILAGWLGLGKVRLGQENEATREQVTTIVNYYYDQGCKPGGQ